jgi:hypothetical protein
MERHPDGPALRPRPARGAESPSSLAIGAALLVHLIADLALLRGPRWHGEVALMLALAVPLAQASLVVLWAGTCTMPPYVRFVIAALATAWTWRVTIAVLPRLVVGSAESAAWAVGLAAQGAVVLAAIAARSLWLQFRLAKARGPDDPDARRWCQYSLGSLLGWTTVAAVLLGLGQTAARRFGWRAETAEWADFRFLSVVSVFNAAYALLVMHSLVERCRLVARIAVAGLVIAAAAAAQPRVLTLLFGKTSGLDHASALILAGAQAVLLYATLVPVRLCHWLGERDAAA